MRPWLGIYLPGLVVMMRSSFLHLDHPQAGSIFKKVSVSSGQSTGSGSPSAPTTNPPIAHQSSMFQKLAQPPTPLSLGINQQRGVMPLQNAVMGAMNPAAEDKKEGTKPTAGPSALPFKPRPMPKGPLGLSKPERPWPSARKRDGASYRQNGNRWRGLMHGK